MWENWSKSNENGEKWGNLGKIKFFKITYCRLMCFEKTNHMLENNAFGEEI